MPDKPAAEVAKSDPYKITIVPMKDIEKLDAALESSLGFRDAGSAFAKTFACAQAIGALQQTLTDEIMLPIMDLQGTRLGFRTDKDSRGGYPVLEVRRCLIEAVLSGVLPVGNQFNIIASNMYLTREGLGHILNGLDGLDYSIVCQSCSVKKLTDGTFQGKVPVRITWKYGENKGDETIEFLIKGAEKNGRHITTADAYWGKADRKAKNWLNHRLTGADLPDGDFEAAAAEVQEASVTDVPDGAAEPIPKTPGNPVPQQPAAAAQPELTALSPADVIQGYSRLCDDIGREPLLRYLMAQNWLDDPGMDPPTCNHIKSEWRRKVAERPDDFKKTVSDWLIACEAESN